MTKQNKQDLLLMIWSWLSTLAMIGVAVIVGLWQKEYYGVYIIVFAVIMGLLISGPVSYSFVMDILREERQKKKSREPVN